MRQLSRQIAVLTCAGALGLGAAPTALAVWQINTVASSTAAFRDVTVTAGRYQDATIRVYAAGGNQFLHEYAWNGSAWEGGTIGPDLGQAALAVATGAGRQDSRIRLYAGGVSETLHEYYYNGTAWETLVGPDAGQETTFTASRWDRGGTTG